MANYQTVLESGKIHPKWVGKLAKTCPKCGIEKLLEEFSWGLWNGRFYPHYCYACANTKVREKYKVNAKNGCCAGCSKPIGKSKSNSFCQDCSDRRKKASCKYYHTEKGNKYRKEWIENGGRERRTNYRRNRIQTDPEFKLRNYLSSNLGIFLRSQGKNKSRQLLDYLGCNAEQVMEHFESQFQPGMTRENFGSVWSPDHIFPISWAVTDEEIQRFWHISNFQPLFVEDNLSKGNRYAGKPGQVLAWKIGCRPRPGEEDW